MKSNILYRINVGLIPAIALLILSISNEFLLFQSYKNDPNNFIFSMATEYIIWLSLFYIFLIPLFFCYWKKHLSTKVTLINSLLAIIFYCLLVFYPNYSIDTLGVSVLFDHASKLLTLVLICFWFKFKQNNVAVSVFT